MAKVRRMAPLLSVFGRLWPTVGSIMVYAGVEDLPPLYICPPLWGCLNMRGSRSPTEQRQLKAKLPTYPDLGADTLLDLLSTGHKKNRPCFYIFLLKRIKWELEIRSLADRRALNQVDKQFGETTPKKFCSFFSKKLVVCEICYIFAAAWGRNPELRCISFYFALYWKDVGNLFGIVRMKKQRDGRRWLSSQRVSAMHHALAWQHSYSLRGVPIRRLPLR